jgi:hypothetical protein
MLFMKSKEKIEKAPKQNYRPPRYSCIVRVGINGFEGEARLKNISSGGFLMESRTYVAITAGDRYTMQIRPEADSGLKLFELAVEVRWIQSSEVKFSVGFLVIQPPSNRSFEKYFDHVKNKNRN